MSASAPRYAVTAAELRRAFDHAFAEAPSLATAPFEDFLAIRVGSDPYAVRLAEVSGVFVDRTVTRLPSPVPEFLGITGFRGTIVPVYDLRALLGYEAGKPRWLLLTAAATLALAFDAFDGYLRLSRGDSEIEVQSEHSRQHVRGIVRVAEVLRPVVHLAAVVEAIERREQQGVPR